MPVIVENTTIVPKHFHFTNAPTNPGRHYLFAVYGNNK